MRGIEHLNAISKERHLHLVISDNTNWFLYISHGKVNYEF